MRSILLNPGPVSLSEGVRRATAAVDLCHREPEFFDLQDRVRSNLIAAYGLDHAEWAAVLQVGSGTTALEAMMVSLVPRQASLLVLENGVYGERLSRIAEIHGIEVRGLKHEWTAPWDLDRVALELESGQFTHLAAVHHETTSGRLNPVQELADLCQKHGVKLVLDAVSSFGAEAIPFDAPALLACAATANKCLHGIPGLCFVMIRRSELPGLVQPPRSLTLDIAIWVEHQDRRSTPFTPPTNSLLALDQALLELGGQGGWQARHARYYHLAERLARCLQTLGVTGLLAPGESSCVLRAYRLPENLSYATLHDGLKQQGFVVYAGQGALASGIFRISTMGDITDYDVARLLSSLELVLS